MPGYSPNAYGGVPAGRAYGAVVENTRPLGVGVPADARLIVGGAAWEGEDVLCAFTMKDTGWPCERKAIGDTDHCLGHTHASAKAAEQREGK